MARLYSDENFPYPVVEELRKLGHDVVTIQERGKGNESISDSDVVKFAVSEDRAVLTLNRRHFIRLHEQNFNHTGIIVCTVDPDFAGQAKRIDFVLEGNPTLVLVEEEFGLHPGDCYGFQAGTDIAHQLVNRY